MKKSVNTRYLVIIGVACLLYISLQFFTIQQQDPPIHISTETVTAQFQNCTLLDNSQFYEHPKKVDEIAYKISIKYGNLDMDPVSLERFACYMAATGSNEFHAKPGVLSHVNPQNYFKTLTITNSTAVQETLSTSKCQMKKKRYKIAFLILVHKDFYQIRSLLYHMYSPDALYIFHVDKRQSHLEKELKHMIETDEKLNHCNVFVLSNSKKMLWGDISIVMAELEGFFQALYMAEWDFIVNMSGYCFPLKSVDQMHQYLSENQKSVWSRIHRPGFLHSRRLNYIMIPLKDWSGAFQMWSTRRYPFETRFPPHNADQWMILSRKAVEYMNQDVNTFDLLAWMEFMYIPDEFFFSTYFMSTPFKDDINFKGAWFLEFPLWSAHPREVTVGDISLFKQHHCFTRKVFLEKENGLASWYRERNAL